ncbi:hypothetical protein N7456_000317 [Penicillium angulare]|uniref:Uncharacterized protein n=1 Tax=Penicillium angulare TaxID=116970 RepID=A0A9W9KS43_9EURO|nr:hypothetical protein N7456_000317 [Penicillium angulare]
MFTDSNGYMYGSAAERKLVIFKLDIIIDLSGFTWAALSLFSLTSTVLPQIFPIHFSLSTRCTAEHGLIAH